MKLHSLIKRHALGFLALLCAMSSVIAGSGHADLEARLFPRPTTTPWLILDATDMDEGATIPADTNVIFTMPDDAGRITRRTLFGRKGDGVRYWGYCFPPDYNPQTAHIAYGFPGKIFLSEAEQKAREPQIPQFSIYYPPNKPDVARRPDPANFIKNELEVFKGGDTCFVTSAAPIPIGTDRDGDGVNARLETQYKTDPLIADTDGDGLTDGQEIFNLKTSPIYRDTDGDGLIDGIEDANRNGRIDPGETSPLKSDTDNDGLCDGQCMMRNKILCRDELGHDCISLASGWWAGEDHNLNGKVDSGESDPTKWSTPNDGTSDLEHYYECVLKGQSNC